MTRQKSKVQVRKINAQNELELENVADFQKPAEQLDLRSQFKALDPKEQEAIINFFNLHNAATWIFNSLSQLGIEYVKWCVELSREEVVENV